MKRIIQSLFILGFFSLFLFSSCEYEWIEFPEPPPPNPNDTISFANEIEPIFNNNDNCTSCHKPGGSSPDLTTDNAYTSIINNNLVNTSDPETSVIYDFVRPGTSTHSWKKYSNDEATKVLQWIQLGALDN